MTKQPIFRRPLFAVSCAFFAAGIIAQGVARRGLVALLAVLAVLSAVSAVLSAATRHRVARMALLMLIPMTLSLCLQLFAVERKIAAAELYDGKSSDATVTITGNSYSSSYYGYYTARLTDSDFPELVVTLGYADGSCREGDVLRGRVTLSRLDGSASFDERAYFIPDGIFMSAELETADYVGRDSSFSPSRSLAHLNRRLCARIEAASGDGALAQAILLGRRNGLSASVKRDFSRIGISHLLALSGIHLSVIIGALELLLSRSRLLRQPSLTRRTQLARLIAVIIEAIAILFFMALVGFGRSVTRAGVMQLVRISATLVGRRSDPRTSLGTAVLVIMLADPLAVRDTAFILSVLAAYACIVYSEYTGRLVKRRTSVLARLGRSIVDTVLMTLLISVLTLPVMWHVFGSISLISPLTNVIFIPTVTLYLYFSLVYTALCTTPVLGALLTRVLIFSEHLICSSARQLSLLPHITVSLRGTLCGVCSVLLFAAVFSATLVPARVGGTSSSRFTRRQLSQLAVLLCSIATVLAIALGVVSNAQSAQAVFVTKGRSEGFAVRYKNDFVLIDVSDGSTGFSRVLTAQAQECGADEIACLVLTHLHRRHIASLSTLAERVVLRSVCLPQAENEDDAAIFSALTAHLEREGIAYTSYSRDSSQVKIGEISFESLGYGTLARSSHPAVAFSLSVAGERYLYFGSSFEDVTSTNAKEAARDADTVFFGAHHPKRKSELTVEADCTAIVSHGASGDGSLNITSDKLLTLPTDGIYVADRLRLK